MRAEGFSIPRFAGVAVFAIVGIAALADGMPELPRGKGETCVEPLELMRRSHMDFLNHERDLTVRNGIRGRKHSLVGCLACHTQRDSRGDFIRIDAPGQFCSTCHEFTGVKIDCFECHAAAPFSSPPTGDMSFFSSPPTGGGMGGVTQP